MAISSGSYSVGSGGDYANFGVAFADLDTGLIGDLTFNAIAETTAAISCVLPSGFLFNGYTLKLTVLTRRHGGIPQNGIKRRINIDHDGHGFDFSDAGDLPNVVIEHLSIQRISAAASGKAIIYFDLDATSGIDDVWLNDLLLDGSSQSYGGILFDGSTYDTSDKLRMWFIIAWSHNNGPAIKVPVGDGSIINNITTWNSIAGFDLDDSDGSNALCKNCYSVGCTTDFQNHGNCSGEYNASDDATADDANWFGGSGSNNLTSVPASTAIESTSETHERFLQPKGFGALYDAGTSIDTPYAITKDMLFQVYPRVKQHVFGGSNTIYTIGAHNLSIVGGDELDLEDSVEGTARYLVDAQDNVEIEEDDTTLKVFIMSASDTLTLEETPDVIGTHVVLGEDAVGIRDPGDTIPMYNCILDTLILRGRVNFWWPTETLANVLTLPQPIDDDEYQLGTRVRARHTKGGDLRVYKRGEVTHVLQMNFRVDRPHRDLALTFFELTSSQLVRFFDWEGRVWHGVITNSPITFETLGKANETEDFTFSLEFEGWRI